MLLRVRVSLFVWVACLAVFVPASARAQGHMLHGVGPINSSMGGAGTALPEDSIAALQWNPALIGAEPGNQISFTTEFFVTKIQIEVNAFGRTGHSRGEDSLGVIPAFGWMVRDPSKKMGLGFALIGVAGFGTDFAEQPGSIIFDKAARGGFGRIFTDYSVIKIPVGFSYQATPKLTIGASLNVYRGNLAISPLPFLDHRDAVGGAAAPAGTRYFFEGGKQVGRFSAAAQFGVYYKAMDMLSFGASLTTPQNYKPYEWVSYIPDPTSAQYGDNFRLKYDLDGPLMITFGTGITPNPKLAVAIDGTWTKYSGVEGFGSVGGIVDGEVYPFGWRNPWSIKAGARYQATPKVNVRFGYAFTQMPLQSKNVLTATGAPATFQNHVTAGVGIKVFPFLTAEASFYYVPREHLEGPYLVDQLAAGNLNPDPTKGGTMNTSNQLTSGLIGLNFRF